MTYKETLFFIGKCLTINHEKHNKISVEEELKSNHIDWDAVVKVSTGHYVFPAFYCNLKRADFLHYLPTDLVEYMKHITDLNRERNLQIIDQAKEINELLLVNNITPIFLKGTGNLLEGLYEDIGERMVGDIDFIVSKIDYKKSIQILKKDRYNSTAKNWNSFHWHYPAMVKENCIGAIEIHNKILKKPYSTILNFDELIKNNLILNKVMVPSFNNQILNAILPKQINDNLYHSKIIPLRTVYDIFLMSRNSKGELIKTYHKKVNRRFNNFLVCTNLLLNYDTKIGYKETKSSLKYLKSFELILENTQTEKTKVKILNYFTKVKNKLQILQYSISDSEYREFTLHRIRERELYLKLFNLKKPKPNP